MSYPIPGYPHGAPGKSKCLCTIGISENSHLPGVVYLNPGATAIPFCQPVFASTYNESGEHALFARSFLSTAS